MTNQNASPSFPRVSESPNQSALVILVHGTYAGDDANDGQKWWQAGSPVAAQLQSRLPRGVRIADGAEVFHWSGDNSERARSKAALKLLDRLRALEAEGRDYHLVGHSHGGSVIWNNKYNHTRIFGLKETDELKNTVYDGDLWRRFRDRQNAMARARRKARKNEVE